MVDARKSAPDRREHANLSAPKRHGAIAAMRRQRVSAREAVAVASMLASAPLAWWRKDRMPLPDLVRSFERPPRSSRAGIDPARLIVLTSAAFRRLGIQDFCVPLSLLAFSRVTRWGYRPEIVFGIAKDGERLHGHAWIEIDGSPVGEATSPYLIFRKTFSYLSVNPNA
jgi:hypothetical protein